MRYSHKAPVLPQRHSNAAPELPPKHFSNAHCNSEAGTKDWGHKKLSLIHWNTVVEGGTSSSGKQVLKATINGIATELVTEGGVSGEGAMENTEVGGEAVATGSGTITYTGVTVAKPAGKGCKIFTDNGGVAGEEGVIHTNSLSTTTTNEMGVKFTPAAGTVFATFILSGCTGSAALEGLNGTYTVNGSVIGAPNGGETIFTHTATTTPETLLVNNSIKAGIDGSTTSKNKVTGNAVVVTTPPYATD